MNQFGGEWTDRKMRIVVDYAKAYLTIMAKRSYKTIYFDGFAGSGSITDEDGDDEKTKKGTALKILDIDSPKPFDIYYFVELKETYKRALELQISRKYADRNAFVVKDNCNKKLVDLTKFLKSNDQYRALLFIDPYGMEVQWASIAALRNFGIDLWILVPTGVSANRLLKRDGKISDEWYRSLEIFLGISREEIDKRFYKTRIISTLFGDETKTTKVAESVAKLGTLYSDRLKEIFKYVSEPFVLKNSMNSVMYHFMMATNNKVAHKIANEVIKPKFGE